MDEKGMEEYLKSIQKTADQLRDDLRPVAIKTIKQSLVLTEVAKAEGIKVEQADLQAEIETMIKDIEGDRKQKMLELLTYPQNQVNIASSIATRRTVEKLTELLKSSETK
jgi:FKBP-type peptidyl-prolyl cis-trans isomerase (trigger factor)